ncbi:NHL repeat-containing protein 2 isoform X1 [Danaus plexippus]|uniref:NHL repeat-containing protein 2 isoform X1 n=1 Tax=Danaus plexippus TaxID=13037 RepID=UPI002AAFD8AF|nr:NHL repeat-containing protein 2 isoform X1 [Danaus plexippus]XP_061379222.1 NHL repeat-containing protein 2 isoform X1 [Danaus plexippus]
MDSSPLDYVAQACLDLTEALASTSNATDRETLITNHIKKVWAIVPPIEDFKKNLEWVNVSEPLSLSQHCSEKVVVLDFWTYCCINCYHVLPDLDYIENLYKNDSGLVVIGVHCAKFTNEKSSSNVLAAVQRYNIRHPVVNDAESVMWETLGIRCWPTLLILGPGNKPIFILTGEGHRAELCCYLGSALQHFATRLSNSSLPVSLNSSVKAKDNDKLYFPSKIALNPFYRGRGEEPFLAISDTGHHRVLLTDCSGIILRVVGGKTPGFKDGKLTDAQFNSPQGLCWLSSSVLVVCDTNNHALRAVHLDEGTVEVLAGTGEQAVVGDFGGKCLGLQALSSPWDVILYTTPDMDMSVRPSLPPPPPPPPGVTVVEKEIETKDDTKEKDKKDEKRRVLLIACAGSHQIWALFLDNTIWWKYKSYSEGTCVCVAGSGAEAARNSAYAASAAFAQPSALALRSGNFGSSPEVFIADSESSSIRRLALSTGQVSTLCGGDRNPLNLFAFGDVDDVGVEAKLQHPMAVAYNEANKTLYVADTYNHKIKKVDVGPQKVSTINPTMIESTDPAKFNEPSGLSISSDGKYLYIADTNNHSIKILNVAKNVCQEFKVRLPDPKFTEPENLILYKNDLFVNRKCGHLIIYFNVNLDAETKNVKFTPGAPQNWHVCVRDDNNKDVTLDDFEFVGCSHKGNKLPGKVEMKLKTRTDKTHYRMYLSFQTALCDSSVCFAHPFTIRSTILVRDSVKMVESYKITCKVNPVNRVEQRPDLAKA